jgi:hypothetical protein
MAVLDTVDWQAVRDHYDERVETHERLVQLHEDELVEPFFRLAMGIESNSGNYSAAEHSIGPRVARENSNAYQRVYDLAAQLQALTHGRGVPAIVRAAGIRYLAVGVGSELSCMVNPEVCWVANTRTIWTHLVVKHGGNFGRADEELRLYRDGEASSEMAYQVWAHIHRDLNKAMNTIADDGADLAEQDGVDPGDIKYIWADAIANFLYAEHH